MPPFNQAAWLVATDAPLIVKSSVYTAPSENEIVVKNFALAINPLETVKQNAGGMFAGWIKYPFTMGSDLAGEVVEVGKGVTRFRVGDRVLGHAVGLDQRSNKSSEGAFQEYTVIRTNMASPIPASLSYENACVIPLALSTAACGLFMKDYLALSYPTNSTQTPGGRGTLLVWGASSSVGCNAVQLAVAAGYEVIATASPKNYDLVKKLGATKVFDYNSKTVSQDIISEFRERKTVGALAIGLGSLKKCIEIMGSCKGRRFVAQTTFDLPSSGFPKGPLDWPGFGLSMVTLMTSITMKSKLNGVKSKFIWGIDNMANDVGKAIYEDFLPQALAQGKYVAAPEPYVIGKGLDKIQEAMDYHKKGVSAKKVVVTL